MSGGTVSECPSLPTITAQPILYSPHGVALDPREAGPPRLAPRSVRVFPRGWTQYLPSNPEVREHRRICRRQGIAEIESCRKLCLPGSCGWGSVREGTGDRLWWDWIKPKGPKGAHRPTVHSGPEWDERDRAESLPMAPSTGINLTCQNRIFPRVKLVKTEIK